MAQIPTSIFLFQAENCSFSSLWRERREEGSGWGTHVYLWQIHFNVWQDQYNIVKFKNKKKE